MFTDNKIWVGKSGENNVYLYPQMANRHGLIAGASGTGKTVTLKVLAESFSAAGVPVFLADIKGDVGGLCRPGDDTEKMRSRIQRFGIDDFQFKGFPVRFWDIYGENGHQIRATVEDMGPMLLARLLDLSDVQTDVLNSVFQICRDERWPLYDLEDMKAALQYINENKNEYVAEYGTMSTQSIGAVQRAVRSLEDQGGDMFFGQPMIDIFDWIKTDMNGDGYINVLHAVKLAHNQKLYATFLMWLMTKLFEVLPEEGDIDKPKLVFFFDEAHMLFTEAPKALVSKMEQMVKLIRSKGVGIYFISQSPSDIPDQVLSQLSNRIQHALRAYTPAEQKAVKAAATAFRANKEFKTEDAITELGVGEALISCLDQDGRPSIVQRASILPPQSYMKALPEDEYESNIRLDAHFRTKYQPQNQRSAADIIGEIRKKDEAAATVAKERKNQEKEAKSSSKSSSKNPAKTASKSASSSMKKETAKVATKATNSAASSFGRAIGTGLVKAIFGKKK